MNPTTTPESPGAGVELAALRRFLARVRLLLWGARVGEGIFRALAVAAVALGLDALLGERLPVSPWAAFAAATAGSVALLVALARLALGARPPGELEVALRVQERVPGLRNDVETGLELAGGGSAVPPGASPALVAALLAHAGEELGGRRPADFVPRAGLRRGALLLGAAALPLAAIALTGPGIGTDALRALVDPRVFWPLGRLVLAVEPGDALVARGAPLVVTARVRGARPEAVLLRAEEAGGAGVLLGMRRAPDGAWTARLPAVAADLRYRALADGAASPWGRARVVDPPAAGNFEVLYSYPAYSGLGPRRVAGAGDLEALPGTTAEISFATTAPVARGTLVAGESRIAIVPAPGAATPPRSTSGERAPTGSSSRSPPGSTTAAARSTPSATCRTPPRSWRSCARPPRSRRTRAASSRSPGAPRTTSASPASSSSPAPGPPSGARASEAGAQGAPPAARRRSTSPRSRPARGTS